MEEYTGTLKDSAGKPLFPRTTAAQVWVDGKDGSRQPLSTLLGNLGVTSASVIEEEYTLENALEPGDLYTVPAYTVGGRRIQIWLDGAYASGRATGAWQEHGTAGATSSVILINDLIEATTVITVRVTG